MSNGDARPLTESQAQCVVWQGNSMQKRLHINVQSENISNSSPETWNSNRFCEISYHFRFLFVLFRGMFVPVGTERQRCSAAGPTMVLRGDAAGRAEFCRELFWERHEIPKKKKIQHKKHHRNSGTSFMCLQWYIHLQPYKPTSTFLKMSSRFLAAMSQGHRHVVHRPGSGRETKENRQNGWETCWTTNHPCFEFNANINVLSWNMLKNQKLICRSNWDTWPVVWFFSSGCIFAEMLRRTVAVFFATNSGSMALLRTQSPRFTTYFTKSPSLWPKSLPIVRRKPLLPGKNTQHQLNLIVSHLGFPDPETISRTGGDKGWFKQMKVLVFNTLIVQKKA